MFKMTVPDGYLFDEVPKSKMLVLPGNAAKCLFDVAQNGNTLNITGSMMINKNLFLQEGYPNLREFYNQVVAKAGRTNRAEEKMNNL